ncbi:MAG TPA: nicotinate-nucleotide adenylyltransferase [Candidatus Limnocylindrales bacterium]
MSDGPHPVVPGSLGVFGGTFDPIHNAHLAVAEEAAEVLGLERVLFVPAGEPPHKPGREITPAHDRLAMVELAIAGNPRFTVDRLEIDRPGPSYTVDTLEALQAGRGVGAGGVAADLVLVLSAEAFLGLMSWREPRRVLELARVAVAPRDGYPDAGPDFLAEHLPDLADRATFLDGPRLRLSASELRSRAASGRSLRYLVPDAVSAYIGDHGLYQDLRRNPRS